MKYRLFILTLFYMGLSLLPVYGDIYKCTERNGNVIYKDTPCPDNNRRYTPPPVMTSLIDIDEPKFIENNSDKKEQYKTNFRCPHFTSTELRNLKVKDSSKKGLSTSYIRKRLGSPDSKKGSGINETWEYKSDYVQRELKFKNNCLVSWKERYKKPNSQFSKYRD